MPSESILVLVGRPRLENQHVTLLRGLAAEGAEIVAWQHPTIAQDRFPDPDVAVSLTQLGLPNLPLSKALGDPTNIEVDEAVMAFMKRLGRTPLTSKGNFRELFRYEHLSLWWWAELFLYHDTPLRLQVRDVEALARLLEKRRPGRLVVIGPVRALAPAARRLHPRVEIVGESSTVEERSVRVALDFGVALLKMVGTGLKAKARRSPSGTGREGCRFLFLSHASMWRRRIDPETGQSRRVEIYFDEIIPRLIASEREVRVVGVGPSVPFKKRGFWDKLKEILELGQKDSPYVPIRRYFPKKLMGRLTKAYGQCWRDWNRFRKLPLLSEALTLHGVQLGRESLLAFRDTFLIWFPWLIRSYHEIKEVLRQERPEVLVLYAEYTALGRAAVAAASSSNVSSFAVQHGILYPRLYANEHDPDEVSSDADGAESVPLPTRTAVFGRLALDLLVERGHYPADRIVITGSPKFDALARARRHFDRLKTRSRLDVDAEAPMLVVASRFSSIGPVFAELIEAAQAISSLWLLVKPHQAENAAPYLELIEQRSASRVKVLPSSENLLELLFASDGLVTVDSFASSEALVLGRPVLVVNLPNNLAPLVERGVALGAAQGEPLEGRIREMLFDRECSAELGRLREAYVKEFAFGADGHSTERIVQAIRKTADERREVTTSNRLQRVILGH